MIDGKACIVIVSDDGDRKAGRPAHFLIAAIDRLQVG